MRNFNKLASLHRVFFKRADRFNSYESGDKGQGKYKPSPPSGNTLGGPERAPKPQAPNLKAPAPKPIPKPEPVPTGENQDFIEAVNKSKRDQEGMDFNLTHPFGRPDAQGVIRDGWVGNQLNPLLLAPSQLHKNLMPFVEKEAPHLNRPPFIMPASPTDGLQ